MSEPAIQKEPSVQTITESVANAPRTNDSNVQRTEGIEFQPKSLQQYETNNEEQTLEGRVFFPSDIKVSLKVILESLRLKTLRQLTDANKIPAQKAPKKVPSKTADKKDIPQKNLPAILNTRSLPKDEKERIVQELIERAVMIGVRNFFNEVDRSDMRMAIAELGGKYCKELNDAIENSLLPHSENVTQLSSLNKVQDDRPETVATYPKSFLRERFRQYFDYLGAENFFNDCSVKTLLQFCEALEYNDEESDHRILVDSLLEEIFLYGVKEIFGKCKKDLIEQCIKESKICRLNKQVFCSKGDMINLLLRGEFPSLNGYILHLDELILKPGEADEQNEEQEEEEEEERKPDQVSTTPTTTTTTPTTPTTTTPVVKRGRGRPPKDPNAPKTTPQKRVSTSNDNSAKKKRKTITEGENGEDQDKNDLSAKATVKSADNVVSPRKGRGRPRTSESKGVDPNRKIEKGVTAQYLSDNYSQSELVQWCKDNKVKYYGTRDKVIERVIQYLNGNTEGIMMENKRGRKSKNYEEELFKKSEESASSSREIHNSTTDSSQNKEDVRIE